jgi:hypothetical protein
MLKLPDPLRRVARALVHAQVAGFLSHPPGLDGQPSPLGEPAFHGVPRAREWDTVASARAPALTGAEVHFTALPDGTLIVDEEVPSGSLAPLADAVERTLAPPYRAVAVRRSDELWTVGAAQTEVVEVEEDVDGDTIELTLVDGRQTLVVDGARASGSLPSLERFASERFASCVVRAERLDDHFWQVDVLPL